MENLPQASPGPGVTLSQTPASPLHWGLWVPCTPPPRIGRPWSSEAPWLKSEPGVPVGPLPPPLCPLVSTLHPLNLDFCSNLPALHPVLFLSPFPLELKPKVEKLSPGALPLKRLSPPPPGRRSSDGRLLLPPGRPACPDGVSPVRDRAVSSAWVTSERCQARARRLHRPASRPVSPTASGRSTGGGGCLLPGGLSWTTPRSPSRSGQPRPAGRTEGGRQSPGQLARERTGCTRPPCQGAKLRGSS